MFNFQFPDFTHTKWDEDKATFEGVEGWWSDDIIPNARVIYADGTWYDNTPTAKHKGYGDIVADLKCSKKSVLFDTELEGHTGFMGYGEKAYSILFSTGVFDTDKHIVFMGHSLGAALIVHVALLYDRYFNAEKPISVRLFGMPRPWGTRKLCKYARNILKDYKSWSIGNEFVDLLHITSFLLGMKRPYRNIKLPSKVVYSGNIIDRIKQFFSSMVTDHYPQEYITRLTDDEVFTKGVL